VDTSLADVIVEELALDNGPQSNWLFAFTYGRGIYRVPLPGAPNPQCTYSVSPTSIQASSIGGIVPLTVSAPPGCAWTVLPGQFPSQFYAQSPAQGSGNGTAFVIVEPNTETTTINDRIALANIPISISQPAGSINFQQGDLSSSPTAVTVPGEAIVDSRTLTSTSTDPVQSCSGSAGFKTAWWSVTAPASGYLQARAYGRRYDVFGNSGVVVTVYPQSSLTTELACAIVPRDTTYQTDAVAAFPVTAGSTYLIEIAATGSTANDGGYTVLAVTPGAAPASISVTPTTATLMASPGGSQQFSAQVANAPNGAVRWSISPAVGAVSPSGVYTPPQSINGPATITVTATSFADRTQQSSAIVSVLPTAGGVPEISLVATNNAQSLAFSQNTWIELKGSNLAPDTRIWQGTDFVNGQLPTQLDGVSVTVNGKPAFVYYISSTQVNVLTPLDAATGTVQIQLKNAGGAAVNSTAHLEPYSPEFFVINGGPYVVATHVDGSYVGPASLVPGYTTPATQGEIVVLYGNGFGQTSPALVNGEIAQSGPLAVLPAVTIGGVPATVQFAGAISPGLYQFNVVIPANAAHGDSLLTATYNGYITQENLLITVK
jgi:uncharacterized protein (TIGR03437 family)